MSDEIPPASQVAQGGENVSVERIDPDGNVILGVEGQSTTQFLVSSKILGMVSPMFAKLFTSSFSEGVQMENSTCPVLTLHDDDPNIMKMIFQMVHYQDPEMKDIPMDAKMLANLAIHCDKYDCIKAVRPWTFKWFDDLRSATANQYGYLLLAAHLFRSAERFSEFSKKAQSVLSLTLIDDWERMEMMHLLPDAIKDALASHIKGILRMILDKIEAMEMRLRYNQRWYEMPSLACTQCGRTLASSANKCSPCKNKCLAKRYCTADSRISRYFEQIRHQAVWHSQLPVNEFCPTEIAERVSNLKFTLKHDCEGNPCPLIAQMEILAQNVNEAISKEARVFDLYPLHQASLDS